MVFGFLFSAVGAYMSGVVGSSNNPISGMTLATLIISSGMLLLFLGSNSPLGPATAILIGSLVCCAAAVSGDNMQDLKSGHMIGATPMKQQIMQLIGIIVPSVIIAPVTKLLIDAYGIAHLNPGTDPLQAPQATLMASVAKSIFTGDIPLDFMCYGMAVAAVVIAVDYLLVKFRTRFRIPVLAAALGMYLPFQLSIPIVCGGLVMSFARWTMVKLGVDGITRDINERNGLLFAAGLITGEAIVGILLALPIVITRSTESLAIFGNFSYLQWPGLVLMVLTMLGLYGIVVGKAYFEERNYYGPL